MRWRRLPRQSKQRSGDARNVKLHVRKRASPFRTKRFLLESSTPFAERALGDGSHCSSQGMSSLSTAAQRHVVHVHVHVVVRRVGLGVRPTV